MAMTHNDQGRYEEAEPLLKRALEIRQHVLGADRPQTKAIQASLAHLIRKTRILFDIESLIGSAPRSFHISHNPLSGLE